MNRFALPGVFLLLAAASPSFGQTSTPVPGDTANALPIEPVRTLSFTTDEGTWISLDVAPDGQAIVFDLLGDLYTIPMAGGQATRITSGTPWDGMPRWSPDGTTIAFISDRDGGDNLWLVSPDGTGLRKLTGEVDNTLSSPAWSPDGSYLVVRRFGPYPTAENYLTNVPLWMYHVGGGSGTRVYPGDASAKSTNTGAAFGPDGRTLYFSSHGGGYTGENLGAYQVVALDLEDGTERRLTSGAGGGLRPVVSPDGRWMVYATRAGARTALRIRDLETHEDRWLVDEVQRDDQEGYAPNDVFPGYAFTPDSRSVVFYGGGKIHRVDVESREVTNIPFSVDVEIGMAERHFIPLEVDDGPLDVTQLLSVSESPDGRLVTFSALGKVWTAEKDGDDVGDPGRLTAGEDREYYPAFSPDGRWVAYVTWADSVGGYLWKAPADGSGEPTTSHVGAGLRPMAGVEPGRHANRVFVVSPAGWIGCRSGGRSRRAALDRRERRSELADHCRVQPAVPRIGERSRRPGLLHGGGAELATGIQRHADRSPRVRSLRRLREADPRKGHQSAGTGLEPVGVPGPTVHDRPGP